MDIVERLQSNTDFSTGMNLAQEAAREIESLRRRLQDGSPIHEAVVHHMAMQIMNLEQERDELRDALYALAKAERREAEQVGADKTGEEEQK